MCSLTLLLVAMRRNVKATMTAASTFSEASYIIADGVRYVTPYVHEFTTFAKGKCSGQQHHLIPIYPRTMDRP
jgi:hypothetical protein